jgi:transcriptional regulator with XRE-family HTH domain
MLNDRVGANIRAAREARGLSLQKLAVMLGEKHWQTIQKLETGASGISIEWVERIAKALDIDPVELISPETFRALKEAPPTGPQVIHLDEQVASEAARSLATAATGDPEPSWGKTQAVALVLRELLVLFSSHPEAAQDVRVARPALTLAGQRFAHEGH